MKRIGEHAVVIGASMGGLLAARALADFYGQVTMLERDAFPVADIPRKGVPQGKHAHGLLARGRTVIEQFFPGWTDEVVGCGGVRGDIAGDVNWIGHGVTIKSAPSDLVGLLAARPVLEGNVRRRLLALPNVRAIEHCAVQGLVADESHSAIQGVRVRIDNATEETILADLVVDASGRGSSSPAWLESFGYARPEEEKIEIGIGYTTRVYRRRPTDLGGSWRSWSPAADRTGATAPFCSRPRTAGSSRSAAISATMRRTTPNSSRPMRARCRHPNSTTSWRMPSR
ncbi:MAG TPA: hypothetical protein VGO01_20210 [Bradyrhizobium sp.]|jgi:hypothetical protein|nr:hypothetical protein [Bradyrhizobium sp.]